MSPRTILTLANGKGIDLLDPKPSDIDFAALAEHIAKEKRYNGATPDAEYSVAEHSCRGADAILAATESKDLAGYFLLHDAAEAFLKDDTTPKKHALAEIAHDAFGVLAEEILDAFDLLTDRFDRAIHRAAGLAWPPPVSTIATIKRFDLVMFVTEWRDLMRGVPHPDWAPYSGIKPLKAKIEKPCWPWPSARAGWLLRANRLLPARSKAESAA